MSDVAGHWIVTLSSPMGSMKGNWTFELGADGVWTGTNDASGSPEPWDEVQVQGNEVIANYTMSMMGQKMQGVVKAVVADDGATISGQNVSSMGAMDFTGVRA